MGKGPLEWASKEGGIHRGPKRYGGASKQQMGRIRNTSTSGFSLGWVRQLPVQRMKWLELWKWWMILKGLECQEKLSGLHCVHSCEPLGAFKQIK